MSFYGLNKKLFDVKKTLVINPNADTNDATIIYSFYSMQDMRDVFGIRYGDGEEMKTSAGIRHNTSPGDPICLNEELADKTIWMEIVSRRKVLEEKTLETFDEVVVGDISFGSPIGKVMTPREYLNILKTRPTKEKKSNERRR